MTLNEVNLFKEEIKQICEDNEIELKINTSYHYTLKKDNCRIDLFPVNKRFHRVDHPQSRGDYEVLTDIIGNFLLTIKLQQDGATNHQK